MVNRLSHEKSPYLQQHAANPVHWQPWDDASLAMARKEDRPLLVSIGYATCHWCHVMEEESFENPAVAQVMNRYFVCIKVDREERPDLDARLMDAVVSLNGSGGWPLNVFLTPDLEPFFGGTYFPATGRRGLPAWLEVVEWLGEGWASGRMREQIKKAAGQVTAAILPEILPAADDAEKAALPQKAISAFQRVYDPKAGGFGGAPKFPTPPVLAFLLTISRLQPAVSGKAESMALHTLSAMAEGGLRDHVGGGFHRYAVDDKWHLPHFEKMLYDNAQLLSLYVRAWVRTENPFFAVVARETADFLVMAMGREEGGFVAAFDADSADVSGGPAREGAAYVWTEEDFHAAAGADAPFLARAYGITEKGNLRGIAPGEFHGENLPRLSHDFLQMAKEEGLEAVMDRLGLGVEKLRSVRMLRPAPFTDDKLLADWNGLAVSALCAAGNVFGVKSYTVAAKKALVFLKNKLWNQGEKSLKRRWREGEAAVDGMATDYLFLGLAALDLYRETGEMDWVDWAFDLGLASRRFLDPETGVISLNSGEDGGIKGPVIEDSDSVMPSATAAAVRLWQRLSRLTDGADWETMAASLIRTAAGRIKNTPTRAPALLSSMIPTQTVQIVLSGPHEDPAVSEVLSAVWRITEGDMDVVRIHSVADRNRWEARFAHLEKADLFRFSMQVCDDRSCWKEETDPAAFAAALSGFLKERSGSSTL